MPPLWLPVWLPTQRSLRWLSDQPEEQGLSTVTSRVGRNLLTYGSGISSYSLDDGLLEEGLTAHDATVAHGRQVDGPVFAVGEEFAEGPAHPGALIEGLCCIANC